MPIFAIGTAWGGSLGEPNFKEENMTVRFNTLLGAVAVIGLMAFASESYATSCDLTNPGTNIDCRYFEEVDSVRVDIDVDVDGQLVKNSNVEAVATVTNVSDRYDPEVTATAVGNNLVGENLRDLTGDVGPQAVLFSNVRATASVVNSNLAGPLTVEATAVGNNINIEGDSNRLTDVGQAVVGSNVRAYATVNNSLIRGDITVNATAVGNNLSLKNVVVRD